MLKPRFKVGEKVYAVTSVFDVRHNHVVCNVCDSTGFVEVKGKVGKFACPACYGAMTTERYGYKYVISYCKATIGKIEIQEYAPKYMNKYKSEIKYMLEETGVGSGTIWREDRLFATEEEANDFCEKYVPSDYYDKEAILRA